MKRNKSILIIEDEKDLGLTIKEMLEPIYEDVIFCSSAIEAKELVNKSSFSLILSDIQMPGMSGDEFLTYLRSVGRIEPVIFVTGFASHEILLMAIRLGVSDVIEKPFKDSVLLESIEKTLEIDKRRLALYENIFKNSQKEDRVLSQKKMIGLLQIFNSKK